MAHHRCEEGAHDSGDGRRDRRPHPRPQHSRGRTDQGSGVATVRPGIIDSAPTVFNSGNSTAGGPPHPAPLCGRTGAAPPRPPLWIVGPGGSQPPRLPRGRTLHLLTRAASRQRRWLAATATAAMAAWWIGSGGWTGKLPVPSLSTPASCCVGAGLAKGHNGPSPSRLNHRPKKKKK